MRIFIITALMTVMVFGQSGHRDLSKELLRDLTRAVSDSTQLSLDQVKLNFTDETNLADYLNDCLLTSIRDEDSTQVDVLIHISNAAATLTIDRDKLKTVRNSEYIRQLELNVRFVYLDAEYTWKGKISDRLTKDDLRRLLDDEFPSGIKGNFSGDQPAFLMILLTTMGVFTLGAALFFMRT